VDVLLARAKQMSSNGWIIVGVIRHDPTEIAVCKKTHLTSTPIDYRRVTDALSISFECLECVEVRFDGDTSPCILLFEYISIVVRDSVGGGEVHKIPGALSLKDFLDDPLVLALLRDVPGHHCG
jgi:hypothetical protein